MAEDFMKYDESETPGFQSGAWYNPYGDCIEYQTIDEAIYGDRVDSLITLHRSIVDDSVIGFQIKGVKRVLQELGYDTVAFSTSESGNAIGLIYIVFAACRIAHAPEEFQQAVTALMEKLSPLMPQMLKERVRNPQAA